MEGWCHGKWLVSRPISFPSQAEETKTREEGESEILGSLPTISRPHLGKERY